MKPKKLTKAEREANQITYRETPWIEKNGYKHFNPPKSTRFTSIPFTFKVIASGKTYRQIGNDGITIAKNGRECILAVLLRDGADYGPIRSILVDNTDLVD